MAGEIDLSNLPDPGGGGAGSGVDLSGLPDQGNDLSSIRAGYADELNDPKVAGKLYALTHREVGSQGPEAQQAFVETVFNRAAARGLTLAQTVSDPNYYPGVSLKPVAFTPDEVTRYQHIALNAAQGSNVSNYATGNASGSVGFAGGPQTARYGGERFGIEGPDRGWAQNYAQAASGVPVQQVDTYTRVEKAVPVKEVEHEVARAYLPGQPRPPLPKGPDTLNQPATPQIDLSGLPDQGEPAGVPPPMLAAPEGNFPAATQVVPPNLTAINAPAPGPVWPTETGQQPAQPLDTEPPAHLGIFTKDWHIAPTSWVGSLLGGPEAFAESKRKLEANEPVQAKSQRPSWALPVARAIDAAANEVSGGRSGDNTLEDLLHRSTRETTPEDRVIPRIPQQEGTGAQVAAGVGNIGLDFADFLFSTPEGAAMTYGLMSAPKMAQRVIGALFTEEGVRRGLSAPTLQQKVTGIGGGLAAGLLTAFDIFSGRAKPGPVAPATEAGVAPAAGEAAAAGGAAATAPEGAAAAATGGTAAAGAETGTAAATRPIFTDLGEELKWLRKNDPVEYKRRLAEEIAKRQATMAEEQAKREAAGFKQQGAGTKPAPPVSSTAPEPAPETPAPAAAAPAPEAPVGAGVSPAAPTVESQWQMVPAETRAAITDELAARGHSPAAIAQLAPAAAAHLVLQPAPDETVDLSGLPDQTHTLPPPQPGEAPGSAWHGVQFLDQDRIKGELATIGFEPDQIDNMTRSQLAATAPAREAARQPAPPEATQAAAPAPRYQPPSLGSTGKEIYQGMVKAAARPPPRARFVAQVIGGPAFDFRQGKPVVVENNGRTFRDPTPAEEQELHDAIDKGQIQAEYRSTTGGTISSWTRKESAEDYRLLHQATGRPLAEAPAARATRKPTKAEAAAEAEHRAELERQGKEAIAAQGGMDLLEAVTLEGGLPLKGTKAAHPYRGELKMLRETIAGTKGVRYRDIFGGKSRGVDDLTLKLQARGFNIQTPHQLIAAIEHRIRTGTPHPAVPEMGETLFGPAHVGETPPPYGEGNPVPAGNTAKLAEDIQTFLDFNKVPPARKAAATEDIKHTLALSGDPALQAFYQGGFAAVHSGLGPELAQALRANKNRLSIIYHDLISGERPTWNIEGSIIANAADLATAVGPIRSPDFESFKVIVRDPVTKRVLGTEITSVGTVDQAILNPRDVFRLFARIKEKYPNAEIIVSHNHPSGLPKPSNPDKNVQRRLHEAASAVGVKLVDHVITNGRDYFSFEQEEVTGNGYGTLPNPVLQPWEVVRQEASPAIRSPGDLERFTAGLRADDPNAVHIFYTGTQMNLKALERVSQGTNLAALKGAISNGIARESAFGVLVDFARVPPPEVIRSLVTLVHDDMGAKLLDASWPGRESARAAGIYGLRPLHQDETGYITEAYGTTSPLQRGASGQFAGAVAEAAAGGVSGQPPQVPRLAPLSEMERTTLETLSKAKASLSPAGKRRLARLEARRILAHSTQGELLASDGAFNLTGEQGIDWVARAAKAEAEEAARVERQAAAQKAQMSLFEKPDMQYATGTARVNESSGAGQGPPGPPNATMFGPNTPPGANPLPIWAKRYADNFRAWWQKALPRSYEIVRKVPGSPVITEHQRLLERELDYLNKFTSQPWWQALRRRPEEELVDLEHAAVTRYRTRLYQGVPRETAWAEAVAQMPPDMQALFQHREGRVPTERWAAGQLAVDEPSYTGDPYLARLTNEEGKAVVDLHPQIANWGRHIRQAIGSFDKSRVHATMKEGIQKGTQYEPPTMAAFVRELYSTRLEGTARMLKALKDKGVLFDEKAGAIAAARALPKSAGPVTLVRGFGGKDYWARTRVEAQFLAQNLNTTSATGSMGKATRAVNAFARNPNLLYNPLPHVTKNMAFKYALQRVGNFTLGKSAREYGTNAQMRARFEAVMPMPTTGVRLPQLRALEAGTYLERLLAKAGKVLSGNHFSARFNFAKADPALRYALWKSYVKKGLGDQEAANHVWVDLIRYDENSGALNFWRGWPGNFFATWRLGTYVSLFKALRNHPIRALLFIGAVEYLREIMYRKFGWWTHLPTDYVDAPLAQAIKDPKTIPAVAATTALFGPGGGQAPHFISDLMKTLHGDPGSKERIVNMFWGLSQLYNIPHEFVAYQKDQDPKHLALILANAAFSTHSALKYNPARLMQWLPEWMPGLQKSAIVREAEGLQAKIQATQQKAATTYEARHGFTQSLEYQSESGQMEALRRAAGVHPPPPGPPKRTRILPVPRSSGRPRGISMPVPPPAPPLLTGQPTRVLQPGAGTRAIIQWMKENAVDPDAARLQRAVRPRIDPDYVA